LQVLVRDNNVDQALKALKKKMQREGIFREMKLRGHYEKPSEKKARRQAVLSNAAAATTASKSWLGRFMEFSNAEVETTHGNQHAESVGPWRPVDSAGASASPCHLDCRNRGHIG
jgi:ribosomal protein S21